MSQADRCASKASSWLPFEAKDESIKKTSIGVQQQCDELFSNVCWGFLGMFMSIAVK